MQGKKSGSVDLPEMVFGLPWNDSLMHQVVTSMIDNARTPTAHVKDRGAVRGGGRKPWKQKGTGRARHGSSRSPIWKGGGVTHGPSNEKNYERKVPKKMRIKALFVALSRKFRDGELVFVDSIALDTPKTAAAMNMLKALSTPLKGLIEKKRNSAYIAVPEITPAVSKSFRNIGSVELGAVRDLNPVTVLKRKYLIIANPDASVAIFSSKIGGKKEVATGAEKVAKRAEKKAASKTTKTKVKTAPKKRTSKKTK